MKSENNMSSGHDSSNNKLGRTTNDFNNEISSGTIGAEGGIYNGASTLRALRKKYAERAAGNSPRKPLL